MSLDAVIDALDLDREGVAEYLTAAAEYRRRSRSGPLPIRATRRSWPSRFSPDYAVETSRVREALAPFIEEDA